MANAMRPTVINVMPRPCRGLGTSQYSIFSRMAPIEAMASIQPSPEPKAKEMASQTLPMYCEEASSWTISSRRRCAT